MCDAPDTREIKLGDYSSPESLVLSGRPKGVAVREELNLDELDQSQTKVLVVVPEHIISLNSSFFLGLFAQSVKRLGLSFFEKKYQFRCRDEVNEDVERGKREALNEANPLKGSQ